jgi:cytochrome c biogenesis protein CcmG, thiol:disulfide interchange protein DsbE
VAEAPLIQRLWPEYQARGYTFIGANVQDSESSARAFIDEFQISFPLVQATNTSIYLEYGVYGLPEAFFITPGLNVSEKFIGELSEAEFRAMLDRLEPAAP